MAKSIAPQNMTEFQFMVSGVTSGEIGKKQKTQTKSKNMIAPILMNSPMKPRDHRR